MRILLITPYFEPDLGPSAPMLAMLSEDLTMYGHTVEVIACVPHYPSGFVAEEYRKRLWSWEEKGGLRVCRVRVPSGDRHRLGHRLLVLIVFQILTILSGRRSKADALIITNPAIETFLPFAFFVWLKRIPAVFCVWDLYPEVGIEAGIFKGKLAIGLVRGLENFCLRRSRWVQVLTESQRNNLLARGIPAEAVKVISVWLDTGFIQPGARNNSLSTEMGWNGKFVVGYAGNMGTGQSLDELLDVADILRWNDLVQFVFIGEGSHKEELIFKSKKLGLSNVSFLAFFPRQRLPEVQASTDLAVVSQKTSLSQGSIPSKLFTILASGRPVLGLVEQGSEVEKIVKTAQAGRCFPPGNVKGVANFILEMEHNPLLRKVFGKNARDFAVEHFDRCEAAVQFHQVLAQIRNGQNGHV